MNTIVNNYPVFEDNQVLTSSQLNQITNYLDQQNRLTRATLIGVGIVCGLEINFEENPVVLTISKGVGVTSEGHLITIGDCPVTRYRTYSLPGSISYPPFADPLTQLQDVDLYELLTRDAVTDAQEDITPLSKAFLADKVVLLFLECFDNDLKSCLGKSCDELGIDRILTLRKLLIGKTDLDKVMQRSGGGTQDIPFPGKYQLPDIALPRTLFSPSAPASHNYVHFSLNYVDTFKQAFTGIFNLLSAAYRVYEPILAPVFGGDPFTVAPIKDLKETWEKYFDQLTGPGLPLFGIQYFYDFVKDLILAYREFRQTAFELVSECCPDMARFPKHLMLGEAIPVPPDICNPSIYWHRFVQPPIYNNQNYLQEKAINLFKRLVMLAESFELERINRPRDLQIKITPSCEKKSWLTDRSIPFYYNAKKNSSYDRVGTLEYEWSYDHQRKCEENRALPVVSYDNHEIDQNQINPVVTPLDFDLDHYNFLRIEGHVGKELFGVIEALERIKTHKNLSFDIKAVFLGDVIENSPRPECLCTDLQPIYSIWRNKILFFLNNMVRLSDRLEPLVTKRNEIINTISSADIGFEMPVNAVKDSWYQSAQKFFRLTEDLRKLEAEVGGSVSSTFKSSGDKIREQLMAEFNDCLRKLIAGMKVDLKDFSLERWLERYRCTFKVMISFMKFVAGELKDPDQRDITLILLRIYCNAIHLLGTWFIYPYINIRIIADTLNIRAQRLAASAKFSNFLKYHPGAEHKSGVAPGETLVLLYQLPHEINWKIAGSPSVKEKEAILVQGAEFSLGEQNFPLPPDIELQEAELENIIKSLSGRVIGDFTVPYLCCDECANLSNTALPLAPLAIPKCGVTNAIFKKQEDSVIITDYEPVKIQMLDNLYDPEIYITRISSDPKFGTVLFDREPYEPDPSKQKQILRYEVDPAKVQQEMKTNKDLFFIDEFDYEFYDRKQEEIVDNSTITIFIPIYPDVVITSASLLGKVVASARGNEIPVPGAVVNIINTNLVATTNNSGNFRISKAPFGDQTILSQAPGYIPKAMVLKINPGINSINITMIPLIIDLPIDQFNDIFDAAGITGDSQEAIVLQGHYLDAFEMSRQQLTDILAAEGAPADAPLATTFSVFEKLTAGKTTVAELNQNFTNQRDVLTHAVGKAKGDSKKRHNLALQNLTFTYLNRLALLEPKKMGKDTKALLTETARIFKNSKDIKMSSAFRAWRKKADERISTGFAKNIDEHFQVL